MIWRSLPTCELKGVEETLEGSKKEGGSKIMYKQHCVKLGLEEQEIAKWKLIGKNVGCRQNMYL